MTPIAPIQQPPIEDLRNALQVAELWRFDDRAPIEARQSFLSICRLLRGALP